VLEIEVAETSGDQARAGGRPGVPVRRVTQGIEPGGTRPALRQLGALPVLGRGIASEAIVVREVLPAAVAMAAATRQRRRDGQDGDGEGGQYDETERRAQAASGGSVPF